MTTQLDIATNPPSTGTEATARHRALNDRDGMALDYPARQLTAAALAVGVVFGFGGNFLPELPQTFAHVVSSIGLVVGSATLALSLLRQRRELVAAGLLVLAMAELVMWNNGSSVELGDLAFSSSVMFYVPGLLLVSIPIGFPIWSRIAGGLAAIPFGIHAVQFFLGESPLPSGPFAIAGYMLMSIAIIGWIVAILRPAPAAQG
jgi:hypothetical protein